MTLSACRMFALGPACNLTWLPSLIPKASRRTSDMRTGFVLGAAPILSAALQAMPHPTTLSCSSRISHGSLKVRPACCMHSGARWTRKAPSKLAVAGGMTFSDVTISSVSLNEGGATHRGYCGRQSPWWVSLPTHCSTMRCRCHPMKMKSSSIDRWPIHMRIIGEPRAWFMRI